MSISTGVPVAAFAQAPADLEAVDARHRDVEDDRLVGRGAEALERLVAVARPGHVIVFERQRAGQRVLHGGLVVDDQYACLLGHDRGAAVSARAAAGRGDADVERRSYEASVTDAGTCAEGKRRDR